MSTTDDAGDIERHIRGYIDHWNARDAGAVWSRFYRLDPTHRMKGPADVRAILEGLDAEGYERTVIDALEPVLLGPDEAVAKVTYTRLKTDGSAMPPAKRRIEYALRRFPDGWRITWTHVPD